MPTDREARRRNSTSGRSTVPHLVRAAQAYILTSWGRVGFALVFGFAAVVGVIGAAIIFLVVAKWFAPHDQPLDPADYRIRRCAWHRVESRAPQRHGRNDFRSAGTVAPRLPFGAKTELPSPGAGKSLWTRYEQGIALRARVGRIDGLSAVSGKRVFRMNFPFQVVAVAALAVFAVVF